MYIARAHQVPLLFVCIGRERERHAVTGRARRTPPPTTAAGGREREERARAPEAQGGERCPAPAREGRRRWAKVLFSFRACLPACCRILCVTFIMPASRQVEAANSALQADNDALAAETAQQKEELCNLQKALAKEQADAEAQRQSHDARIKRLIEEKTKVETLCASAQLVRVASTFISTAACFLVATIPPAVALSTPFRSTSMLTRSRTGPTGPKL